VEDNGRMKHRRSPPFALILALLAFVFAQLMGAVHACEMGMDVKAPSHAATAQGPSDCCDETPAATDPNCDNHCRLGDKAPDRVQLTASPATVAGFAMPVVGVAAIQSQRPLPSAPHLARHIEPPISVRNCCFRI